MNDDDTGYLDYALDRAYPPLRIDIAGVAPQATPPEEVAPATGAAEEFLAQGGMTLPADAQSMTPAQMGQVVLDGLAGMSRGGVKAVAGFGGDVEQLGTFIKNFITDNQGGGFVERVKRSAGAFESPTLLQTSKDIEKEGIGLLPGAPLGSVKLPPIIPPSVTTDRAMREKAAAGGELAGEVLADPFLAARAIKAGAGAVKGIAQEIKTTAPVGAITSKRTKGLIKLAPNLEVEIAPAERSKNFKNWFGDSKIVDDKGKPLVMYHGTSFNFDEFQRGNAIFVTPDPKFASEYSRAEYTVKAEDTPNVIPLYVKADNPFDYEKPEDVKKVVDYLFANNKTEKGAFVSEEGLNAKFLDIGNKAFTKKTLIELLMDSSRIENWEFIENPIMQKAIRNLKFDAFYVKENKVKNLAVFDSAQLKSAIGNRGTFDPKDPNILRGAVAAPVGVAATQDEEK